MTTSLTVETFEQDALNLHPFAARLEKFMLIERHFVEGALVVSLGAPYGSGKSTFLRMWAADLRMRQKDDPTLPIPIVLNAWESDFCADPFLAVISSLIEAVETKSGAGNTTALQFREAAKQAAWFGVGIANSIVSNWSGIDPIAAGDFAKRKSRKAHEDIFANYRTRLSSLATIRSELSKHFGGTNSGALILIDELDRCRPDYAIGYLETVKHIFGVKGLMFVLAVDSQRLAASAQTVFGALNFDEFYRKFVHRSVSLPEPDDESRTRLSKRYIQTFLEREGMRVCLANIQNHHIESLVAFASGLKLTPRQFQEVVRILGHIFAGEIKHRGQLFWCLTAATLLMAVIRVGDSTTFEKLRKKTMPTSEFILYLRTILGSKDASWWASLYITGSNNDYDDAALAKLFENAGLKDPPTRLSGSLVQFYQGWGHGTGRIFEIVSKIDELKSFG